MFRHQTHIFMKVVIAGGNSYLGKTLANHYSAMANGVVLLARRPAPANGNIRTVLWDGKSIGPWADEVDGADLLINMAGRSVNCRYSEKNKKEIFDSRTQTTEVLGDVVRWCEKPPKVWLNAASATIYRHAEDRFMDEYTGELGQGFSVEVCKRWEKTFFAQKTPHTRKVALRTAIVFGKDDGVYLRLKNLAKMGLGGKQGNGRQMVSWIHEADFARATEWIYGHREIDGVINLSAPNPLPNKAAMKKIRRALGVSVGLPAPEWLLEMGAVVIGTETELILKSRWVIPARLIESGFVFRYPTLDVALSSFRH